MTAPDSAAIAATARRELGENLSDADRLALLRALVAVGERIRSELHTLSGEAHHE